MNPLPIAGGILSAFGSFYQGIAAGAAADYNAGMYRQNAAIVRQQAVFSAQQQARENYLRLGEMRANIGASGARGGDAGAGSFLDVLADTAAQGELEKQQILYAGEVKAHNLEMGAALEEYKGKTARIGGYLSAGADLLGAAGGGSVRGPSGGGSRASIYTGD
jgi:hypothetical protein